MRLGAVTVAVLAESSADLAAGDHTHVEADITDLAHTTDHGALGGLTDDDHAQYLLAAGTRQATYLDVSGLTGATSASRYVGATTSGSPASGTFAVGDYVVARDGSIFVCTVAGTPGTWVSVAGSGLPTGTTAGDLAVYNGTSWVRIGPGANDTVLTADSAQTEGVKWAAGGGGAGSTVPDWIADLAAPDSAHGDDQEFTGAIGGTAVTPTGTVTWTQDEGLLSAAFDTQTAGDHCPRLYALTPTVAPVTLTTRMRQMSRRVANPMAGLLFADGTTATSNATAIGLYHTTTGVILARWVGTLTNMTTTNLLTDLTYTVTNNWDYLRLIWSATNTFEYALSPDGVSWSDFADTGWSATLTPTHFGPFVSSWNRTETCLASFEYVRVTESDLSV
jgi:hypothetical protein